MSQPPAPVHDLTINKVLAGAGAAVTSAVLGSFFGVAGTVIGAAIGSVASTVATTLYQRSLDRTRDRILARLHAGAGRSAEGGLDEDSSNDGGVDDEAAPHWPTRHRRGLLGLLGATVLVFVLGMAVVTGVELVKGSTVAGQPGTSIGGVLVPEAAPTTDPSSTDTPSTRSATTHVKSTRDTGRAATPSAGATSQPAPSATPSAAATTPAAATQNVSPG